MRSFAIIQGETPESYEHRIAPYPHGHLLAKSRHDFALKPTVDSDSRGNAVVLLGYMLEDHRRSSVLGAATATSGGALEAAEGQFAVVFFDAQTDCLHIVNDRFASRPVYVVTRGETLFFSSNLAFLLHLSGVRCTPDVQGWLEVATVGHTIGSRTTTESVARLLPATHLTVSVDRTHERQYWRLRHTPDLRLDPVRHSREVFETFAESTARRVNLVDKGIVALSGGWDSRLLVGAMPKHVNYSAFTFGDSAAGHATPETAAASDVCSALGVRHHVEALRTDVARADDVLRLTAGMRPYQHMAIVMAYVHELKRQGAPFLIGGGPGDSLAGGFVPAPAYVDPARTRECLADALERRLDNCRQWPLVFRDDVIAGGRAMVRRSLGESLASVCGPTAAHTVTAWAMVYRQPAFTFTSLLHTHPEVTEAACHLGYRYTDFMLMLPAPWLYRKKFYTFMIYTQLPELQHIPYANTGELASGHPPTLEIARESVARRVGTRSLRFARRSAARLYRSVRPARGTAPSLLLRNVGLLKETQEAVHSEPALRALVDVRRCDRLIERTVRGDCRSEEMLGTLVSLALTTGALSA